MARKSLMARTLLDIDSIVASYDGSPIHQPVSCTLRVGEIGMFVGGNGCGKTSVLRAILGILCCRHGTICILGKPRPLWKPWTLTRRNVRVIPQFHVLPEFLSVGEYITGWSPTRDRRAARRRSASMRIEGVLRECADIEASALLGQLSFGQRRLIEIVLAFESHPDIILADEPLASVASTLIPSVMRRFRGYTESGGAVVVVAHKIEAVHWEADWTVEVIPA